MGPYVFPGHYGPLGPPGAYGSLGSARLKFARGLFMSSLTPMDPLPRPYTSLWLSWLLSPKIHTWALMSSLGPKAPLAPLT